MRRTELLRKIRKAARSAGVTYEEFEMTRHTGLTVGGARTTIARHAEIPDQMAEVIFKQLQDVLGKGWWRR